MNSEDDKRIWDEASDAWVDFVRTGKDYCRLYMNNPAIFETLGDIKGKRLLDLACGEGYNTRLLAQKGAVVTGVDFSKEMISLAIEESERCGIRIDYHVSDASDLRFIKDGSFDIVTCFMAIQDIDRYDEAFKEVSRILKPDGRFVFIIPHPCFEVRFEDGKRTTGWVYKDEKKPHDGENAIHYTTDHYFDRSRYVLPWNMARLAKPFVTSSYHHTLTEYSHALRNAGMVIVSMSEPRPTEEALTKYREYFENELRIPQSIVFDVTRKKS